jgi:hypothetical protein
MRRPQSGFELKCLRDTTSHVEPIFRLDLGIRRAVFHDLAHILGKRKSDWSLVSMVKARLLTFILVSARPASDRSDEHLEDPGMLSPRR